MTADTQPDGAQSAESQASEPTTADASIVEASQMQETLDLAIHESTPLAFAAPDGVREADGDGIFNSDGTVNMVLIRPCHGRGMYNNIYEADMLARNAGKFKGLPIFDNHDSPVARTARRGLPRAPSELGGAVRESWWDRSYTTADDKAMGFGAGAVIGKCKLTGVMEALVRDIPEVVKGSLNTEATAKRPAERNGKKGWVVEGFAPDKEHHSFDLVTAAGAGGRVASVLEATYADSDASDPLTAVHEAVSNDSVSDDDLLAVLREHRPGVLESQGGAEPMNLREALQSDEVQALIRTTVDTQVDARVQETASAPVDVDAIRQEIRDELAAGNRVRGLAAAARGIIETAKLPQGAKTKLLADYGLTENDDETVVPGRALSVIEAVIDDDGKVTKAARDVLIDSLKADIVEYRTMIAEAAPTVPRAPITNPGDSPAGNDVQESAWEARLRQRGLDPTQFGAPKPAAAAAGQ